MGSMYNSYKPGQFTIILDERCWLAYSDKDYKVGDFWSSCLLHEFIHYLQETTTSYGVLYQQQMKAESIPQNIVGDRAKELHIPMRAGKLEYLSSQPIFKPHKNPDIIYTLGSNALKESMAFEAQQYVCDESLESNGINGVYYLGFRSIINDHIKNADKFPLSRFCMEDCCLMTENPVSALMTILKEHSAEIYDLLESTSDVKYVKELYYLCEAILVDEGMLCYENIQKIDYFTDDDVLQTAGAISDILYENEEDYRNDEKRVIAVSRYINKHRTENLSLRCSNHCIIAQSLQEYSKKKNIGYFFDVFGMPVIRQGNDNGCLVTNIDDFPNE